MALDQIIDRVQETVGGALKVRQDIASPCGQSLDQESQRRIQWLEGQLASVISQLQGIALDLESGLSLGDLGYASEDEFYDMLENIDCDVRRLQRAIREMKGQAR